MAEKHKYYLVKDTNPGELDYGDFFSTFVTAHKRYSFGPNSFHNLEAVLAFEGHHKKEITWAQEHGLFRKIKMYDHSGLSFALDEFPASWPDTQWDAGPLGFIYLYPKTKKEREDPERVRQLKIILETEFDEWAAYYEGDTYLLLDKNRNIINSGRYSTMKEDLANMSACYPYDLIEE